MATHSICSLYFDRFIASWKRTPTQRDLVLSLSIKIIQWLLTSSSSSSRSFYLSFSNVQLGHFLRKLQPNKSAFLLFTACRMFLSTLIPCNIPSFFTRSVQSSPFCSNTILRNFSGISDLISVVTKFQHHTKLWSWCSISLVSSVYLSPICWRKKVFLVNVAFAMTILDLVPIYILHWQAVCVQCQLKPLI